MSIESIVSSQIFLCGFRWWVTVTVICGFDLEVREWNLWVTILF